MEPQPSLAQGCPELLANWQRGPSSPTQALRREGRVLAAQAAI